MVETGGGTASGAEAAVRRLVDRGATGLISFGLAGGLDPALRPGAVIVPEAVLTRSGLVPTDPVLNTKLGGMSKHRLLGGDQGITSAAAKRDLWTTSGCAAVDLESGAVAMAAVANALPFAVLRAICDPEERDLPPAALGALDGAGAIGLLRVVSSLLARPGQLPSLLVLARDAAAARRALIARVEALRGRPKSVKLAATPSQDAYASQAGYTRQH